MRVLVAVVVGMFVIVRMGMRMRLG